MLRLAFYTVLALAVTCCIPQAATATADLEYGPYHADHIRTLDGDTIELSLHIFPGLYYVTKIRERTIDTPEKGHRAESDCERKLAQAATEYTEQLMTSGLPITVDDIGFGTYTGRMVGKVFIDGVGLGEVLKERGLAVPYLSNKADRGAIVWCHES